VKLTQVDVLAKDRSSTIASAIGGDVDQIRRSVSIDSEPSLEVTPIVGASTWQDFAERRILKLTYASAPIELWEIEQIDFSRGQQPGQKGLTCRPLWMRLDDQIAHLTLSDGTKDPNLTLTSVGVTTALNRVLGAAWNSPAFINPGSIDSAIQGSVVNLFRSAATHKEWLTAIKEDLNVQWTARWDSAAGEYKVDLVERVGDPDASVRTIRETQQSQGDIVNRLRLRGQRSVDNYFSGVVPLGGAKNQGLTMAGARWPIRSTSYDSTGDETTIVFQDEPVWDDGVLTNAQVTNGGSTHAVQSSSAPDQVIVSGDVSGWDVLWFVDGGRNDLIELRALDAESQVGRRTRSKRFSGVVPQENLLERAGVNTAADSLDGWAAIGSNTNLTVVTSGDYVRNGEGSIEVNTSTASEEEGIRTSSMSFDKAEMGEVVSAFVAVYVAGGGTIQVQLVDSGGKEYPADETIEGGEATLRGYTIEGAKPPTGSLFLKVTKLSGDPTFYVDAATVVASAKARGFAPAMGPRALWQKGAGYLLREGGVPDRTLDGQVVDLSVLESRGKELTLGDATTVILHDGTEIEGRITSTQRDLVVGSDTTAFQVALGEPIDNALDRFFDPLSGEPPGDGTGGTDRVQPVLQSVEMSQSGPIGELSFEVSDPLGVVQKVQTRAAEGRNIDPSSDSYSDLTPSAGTYTDTVGLTENHNSYIQVRLVTGPQVDDVERVFAFDRDQIPEADYNLKWSYNASRDAVEARIVAVGDEDTASYRFGLDTDRDGTDDEVVTVDTRATTQLLNPNVSLPPGSKVDVSAKAFSKTGQAGNEQPEPMVRETFEVPRLSGTIPQARPTLNATPNQNGDQGELKWTVDDPAGVVNDVLVRTASGRNLDSNDSFSAPTDDNSPYAETVALTESHNSYIEVKIELSSGLEDIRRMFAFDRNTVPEATYTLEWRWNSGIELRAVASGDEDVSSYAFGLDQDRDGTADETVNVDARSTTELLNGSTSLTAGELVDVTAVAYAETGQSGEAQPAAGRLGETVEVPALSEDIPEARPTISATPNQSGSTGEAEWTVDDPAGVVDDVQTRKASGRNLNSNDSFSAPSDDSSPYSETVALTESHNSYIEIRLVTSSGIEDVRRLFAFDRDTVPEATYSVEWTYDSGIIMYVVAKGDEDVASYRFGLDVKRNGTIDETTDVDGRSVTTVVNGATRLTPGEFVRIAARAFSETGQAGEVQPADGQLDDPVEVPELEGTNPDTVPTINADLDQISGTPDKGELDFTVDDPDGVLTQVEVRTAAGRNLKSSDSYSTLSKSGGTYTQRVDLSEKHASFIQVRLNVGGDLENVTRTFSFDADRIPEADYTPKWVWNQSRQTVELVMVAQGDEDVSSYQFTIDAGVTGVVDNTENIGARSTSTLVNPSTALAPGTEVKVTGTAYSETGQSGNVESQTYSQILEVPPREDAISVERPVINAELKEPDSDTGRLEWTVDDPDNVVNNVEVRTKQGGNFDGEGFSSPSETNPYAEEVGLVPLHNSYIEVKLSCGAGVEDVRQTYTFDPDDEPTGDITLSWDWTGNSQELTVNYVGDDDVESWKFQADLDNNGTFETTHTTNNDAGTQTINPGTTLSGGDTIGLKITCYTEDGQGGNAKVLFDGTLEVPLPREEVPLARPTITGETLEPNDTTGRVEWTVDDPDNVVNSVEVRTKQGGNFDGESFSSPSETNPYAEEVTIQPAHNSFIEVRLVTESDIENIRKLFVFDPDEEPNGTVNLRWRWDDQRTSQELKVEYVGDDDVESWKFQADLDNNGTFETTHTTNNDAGTQTINPGTTLSGGDTIGLKITCYTEDGQGGNAKVLFDGTLEVPLPREEVPLARPTITGETLEPNDTTGRVEWTVDDPDNVVNSVEVRTKQGGNFDGESFSSPSETNPYAEEVTIQPAHNSFIEVRLVTESDIENIRKLFVFDPDEEPNGTVNLRWRWDDQRTSQELKVEYVGDDDVESWKFLADLNNDGIYETEHNTSTDAGAQTINPNYDLSGGDTIGLKVICYTKNSRNGKSKLLFDGSLDVPLPREEVPETRPSITVEDIRTFRSGGDLFGEVEWTYDDPDGIVYYTEVRVAVGENLSGTSQPPSDDTSPFSETVEIEDKHTSYIEVQLKTYGGYDNVRQVFPFDADTRPEGSVELRWEYDAGLGGIKGVIVTTGDDDVGSWKFTISDGSNQDTQYVDGQSVTEQLNKSFGLDPGQTVSISADAYSKTGQSGTVNSILRSETFVVMADIDAVADGDGVVIEGKHILLDGATTIDGGLDLFQTGYHHPALKQAIQDGKLIERISFTHPNDVSGTELTGPLNGRRYKFQDGATMVAGEGPYDVACKIDQSAGSEPRVAVEFSVSSVDPDVAVGGWFKVPEGNTDGVLYSMDASEYFRVYVATDGNLKVNDNLGSGDIDTGRRIDDGRWHHIQIAYLKQGSTTRTLVYIDGTIYVNEDVSGSLGSGNTRYLMVGVGSEATAYDGSTGGGQQITFYCQDLFCYKGGSWDNDYAVPMAANPDQFAPIGRVHGDLLVEDTVRAEVVDAEQLFTETFILQAGGVITNNASPKDFRVNNDGFEINAQDTGSGANSFDIIDFGTDTIYGFLTGSSNTVLLSALNSAVLKLSSDGKTRIQTDSGQFVEIISDYLQVNKIKGVGANAPVQLHEGMKVGANPVQFEWDDTEKGMVFRDARSSQPSNSEMDALLNPLEMFLYLVEDPDEGGSDVKLQFFEKKSDGTVEGPKGFGAD
jgi:hypothetical protein